jgi:ATP-dependent exoDNAse (exonuclease V) beta subunit
VISDGRARYDRWRLQRDDARRIGSASSLRVQTAREWASNGEDTAAIAADAVTMIAVADDRERAAVSMSGGQAFGLLVHEIMALVPLDADRSRVTAVATAQAQLLGLTAADVEAAVHKVQRLLQHDLMQRARAADERGECRRETPVTCLVDDTVVEGVVDLAFLDGDVWHVVDFKTDREISAAGSGRYERQVRLYAAAIAQAMGTPARPYLLRI